MIEQNTLKRRGVGLKACNAKRAYPGFTLFAPLFVESRTVYLIGCASACSITTQAAFEMRLG